MASPAFISTSSVRDYLDLNSTPSSSKYTDGTIGSNIRAASDILSRATGRQWEAQSGVTKRFTTNGLAAVTLPGLRTTSGVSLQGTAMTADSTYYLIPDSAQTGLYTGIQFRAFGNRHYLSNPEWFDRNLDHWRYGYSDFGSLPNDLSITGDWGLLAADYPEGLLHATKVLAAYYTKRPDSVLASVATTVEGTTLDYSSLPPEVADPVAGFVALYRLGGAEVVSVG